MIRQREMPATGTAHAIITHAHQVCNKYEMSFKFCKQENTKIKH